MINMKLIVEAIHFITCAHENQFYGDMPYALHPINVAATVDNPTTNEYIAALLHDVVEDTSYSISFIRTKWGADIACIVALLTKDKELTYEENIKRIISSGNISAMKVKLADNKVNMSGDKSHMLPDRKARLIAKYNMSINMLTNHLNGV